MINKKYKAAAVFAAAALCAAIVTGCAKAAPKNQSSALTPAISSSARTTGSSAASSSDFSSSDASGKQVSSGAQKAASPTFKAIAGYKRYESLRYGFSIDYPSELAAGRASDNGDGQSFMSTDKSVRFSAFGSNNVLFYNAGEYLKNTVLPSLSGVAYKSHGNGWFIVSWKNGNKIGYEKGIVGKYSINAYIIEYPAEDKDSYDPVIKHINASFKTPGVDSYH